MKKSEYGSKNETTDQTEQVHPAEGTDVTLEQISDTYKEGTIEDTDRDEI
ncbi:DUF4025 domain-containing protein [Bacillus sp. ISL-51]|nr:MULTISPECIES: DUF4025 domain-containing protein [Bacteria]MBT2575298.1 DUF4025 domain-containing protein [Bacillus sp. ISL-51]MBT2712934.1 DUF4025 domain-containing protein [Pseudomonas sp. ISL-88]